MYRRRLALLAAGGLAGLLLLAAQTARLTILRGDQLAARARSALTDSRLLPTRRGRILDRAGRVLAADRPGHEVAVAYEAITGGWAMEKARDAARARHAERWDALSYRQRERLAADARPRFERALDRLWAELARLGGVEPATIAERKRRVRERVQQIAAAVWSRHLERRRAAGERVALREVAMPIREQRQAHELLPEVSAETALAIRQRIDAAEAGKGNPAWRAVTVRDGRRRAYPRETRTVTVPTGTLPSPLRDDGARRIEVAGVATHLVGWMRNAWKEDVRQRPLRGGGGLDLGGYLPGDRVGARGVEAAYEKRLRGRRGRVRKRRDGGAGSRTDPVPGRDVRLTIDIGLQARVQAVLKPELGLLEVQPWHRSDTGIPDSRAGIGAPLQGAAVVTDLRNGEVLAAGTSPTFPRRRLRDDPDRVWQRPVARPWINRAIARSYQPGSTVKPLVLAAAVTEGALEPGEIVETPGHLWPDRPNVFRDWIYKEHGRSFGELDGVEAVARSSNVFFGKMGLRLENLVTWFRRFGLGRRPACGLPQAASGDLPGEASSSDRAFMAIGQGPVRWTPLQAAAAYTRLVSRGPAPTLIEKPEPSRPDVPGAQLPSEARRLALDGMHEAANNARYGTANHISALGREPIFQVEGVRVWGKTGTAEAVPLRGEPKGGGPGPVLRSGDHAWFVALVSPQRTAHPDRPWYAITVVVDYGGAGGAVAGPVANQLIAALKREGYL